MTNSKIPSGTVHTIPADLRKALASDKAALAKWNDITPLARNEWICWTTSVKRKETRDDHVRRVCSELKEGIRRPCCWAGCIHRADKAMSPSQKFIYGKKSKYDSPTAFLLQSAFLVAFTSDKDYSSVVAYQSIYSY